MGNSLFQLLPICNNQIRAMASETVDPIDWPLNRPFKDISLLTADCREDKYIEKTFQEAKCSWEYAGQKVFISTNGGKN